MPKFFTDAQNINGKTAVIFGQDAIHISRVLRMEEGDSFTLCDGCGWDYTATITEVSNGGICLSLSDKRPCPSESDISVTLFQCLPKGSKMEFIVEKCTELGADFFVPVASRYCVAKLEDSKKESKKTEKWQKTASEAAKQCQRGIIPVVKNVVSLASAAKNLADFDLVMVAYEKEEKVSLKSVLKENCTAKKIAVFIGPEGGFDEKEISLLKENGAISVTLGSRILRTETAGLCVLSAVMYELGGF